MGTISHYLLEYLKRADPSERVNVVIRMANSSTASISRVPQTEAQQREAKEVIRASGFRSNALQSPDVKLRRALEGSRAVSVQVPVRQLEELAASEGVEFIRPERVHRAHLNASVGLLGVNAGVHSRFEGRGIRVAVLDSGIDPNHPDFAGRLHLGDSRNFTTEGPENDVTDLNGHGTHVAGIVGGAGATFRGVAPGVEFIICKVFDKKGRGAEGAILNAVRWAVEKRADVINYSGGFAPVDELQRAIIQPPWVWPEDLLDEEDEFVNAMESGTVCCVSAGNEGEFGRRGTLSMPATCPAVISVASMDKNRAIAPYSSAGPAFRSSRVSQEDFVATLTNSLLPHTQRFDEVDLTAPGGGVDELAAGAGGCFFGPGIISALASKANEPSVCTVQNQYVRMSGTSQASPHIAGLSALVLHAARELGIDLGERRAFAVKGILRAACTPLIGPHRSEQGSGVPEWMRLEGILNDIADGRRELTEFL